LTARQARPNVAVVPREPVAVLAYPPADVEREARALAALCPRPARVGAVWCGTAGWTDPTLIACGRFYPANATSPADRLAHYASHFPMVEVDATYHAIPSPSVAQRWVERTPNGFVFDVKAHPVLTGHPLERARLPKHLIEALAGVRPDKRRLYPRDLPAEVRDELVARFCAVLEPLQAADKLGCVMIQLPPWTTATRGAVRDLERLPDLLPGVRLAVEFRHPSWLEEGRRARVFDLLRANRLAYTVVDEPDVPGAGVPPIVTATRTDLAVVRFHGHNVAGWRSGASVLERFNYLYSAQQIRAWAAPVRQLADQASQVHAVFNNCVRDFAVLNAKDLAAVLAASAAPPAG